MIVRLLFLFILVAVSLRAEGETIDLLRKHGGKTGEELKAEGK